MNARTAPPNTLGQLRAWRREHARALVSSFGRFLHRPLATALTVAVMALALALPLGLGVALANLERLAGGWDEPQAIAVFLRPEIDAAAAARVADAVRARADVAGVRVQTPEEGLADFRRLTDTAEALDLLDGNPLPALGTTVLVASHDLPLVKRMRKRVLVLANGRLMDDIPAAELAA